MTNSKTRVADWKPEPIKPKGYQHCIDCLELDLQYDKRGHPTGLTICHAWAHGPRAPYENICSMFDPKRKGE